MKKKAIVVGATGLVGGFCVKELLQNDAYGQVLILVRQPLDWKHPKLKQLVVDFDRLEKVAGQLKAQDIFSCLGTTRKKSPSREAYRKIEFEYAFKLAQITSRQKAEKFLFVSSMGADAAAGAFYLRLKGETEEVVSALPFKAVHLFRPSFITGERGRKERRPSEALLEALLIPLGFLFAGPLRKYRPISAQTIAKAMVRAANGKLTGVHIWESNLIEALGS